MAEEKEGAMDDGSGACGFVPLVPNAETIEACMAARNGELMTVEPPESLLGSLNAVDFKRSRRLGAQRAYVLTR